MNTAPIPSRRNRQPQRREATNPKRRQDVDAVDDATVVDPRRLRDPTITVNAAEADSGPPQPQELQPLVSRNTRTRRTGRRESSALGNDDSNLNENASEKMSETVVVEPPDLLREPDLEVVPGNDSTTMMIVALAHAHHPWLLVALASHLILWTRLLHLEILTPIFRTVLLTSSLTFLKTTRATPRRLLDLLEDFPQDPPTTHRQDLLGHHRPLQDLRDLHRLAVQERLTI